MSQRAQVVMDETPAKIEGLLYFSRRATDKETGMKINAMGKNK
jgi:hypothetical protein